MATTATWLAIVRASPEPSYKHLMPPRKSKLLLWLLLSLPLCQTWVPLVLKPLCSFRESNHSLLYAVAFVEFVVGLTCCN